MIFICIPKWWNTIRQYKNISPISLVTLEVDSQKDNISFRFISFNIWFLLQMIISKFLPKIIRRTRWKVDKNDLFMSQIFRTSSWIISWVIANYFTFILIKKSNQIPCCFSTNIYSQWFSKIYEIFFQFSSGLTSFGFICNV